MEERLLAPSKIIDKTDLAPHVGADLGVMARDAAAMRGEGPTVFAQVTNDVGVSEIAEIVLTAWRQACTLSSSSNSTKSAR